MKRVVVTGLGAITPVGNSAKSFFAALTAGRLGIGEIKSFDTEGLKVKIAAEVKDFAPADFMPQSEVKRTDLYTQYAMAAAVQAYEDSGLAEKVNPERFGVYFGSGIGGMQTFFKQSQVMLERGPSRISPFFIPMMIGNIAAGSIAIRLGAKGPCLPVVTACATGSHSVGEAFRAIRHGYADVIMAGGAEAAITPLSIAGFTSCMALCQNNLPEESSVPFDKRRCGFVMGEGAGALVLEEYAHAKARGAKIYAEVTGYGNTADAFHITAPHPEGEGAARAIRLAMAENGPYEKLYINAHGTSTPLNDKTETLAIKLALGSRAYQAEVSSTKSMTGHMLGAAGAVEAIAAVKALQTGVVPPTIGYREKDPDCDLDYVPLTARESKPDTALSVSLGFGGHNACLAFKKI